MKRKRKRSQLGPTIHLIAEDQTGYFVFDTIIRKKGIKAVVELVAKPKNLSDLGSKIEALIRLAIDRKKGKDCIIVLHDTDDSVETNRKHYERIAQACEKYQDDVTRLPAVQEIEAWLLADSGLCKWLRIKPRPSDHVSRPSDRLRTLINDKTGKQMWNEQYQPKILENMDATGDQPGRSQSMQAAMNVLLKLPCTQLKTK